MPQQIPNQIQYAEMSEWSIVQSWNGCVRKRTPGSNPGLCATGIVEYLRRYSFCFRKRTRVPLCSRELISTIDASLNANPVTLTPIGKNTNSMFVFFSYNYFGIFIRYVNINNKQTPNDNINQLSKRK